MKRILLLLFVMAIPMMGFSQSTLNFPKLFSAAELPNTGFAIVNPGTAAASTTFTLYSATGATVSTKVETVAAGGQFAKSGDQIFSALGSGGWVQATSTATGLTGFWINYAGDLSYLDGADGAPAVPQLGVFPLVAGQTQVNIVNLAAGQNDVRFQIHAADGTEVATSQTKSIAAKGVYSAQVTELFPGVNMDNANYIRATALGGQITGTSFVRGYLAPVESAVVNMVDGAATDTSANFPHMANGVLSGLNYSTVVDVVNLASAAQTVTITFTPDTGSPVSVQRQLAPLAALRDTATNLFSLPSTFVGGFVRVTGTAALTGFAAFADSVGGQVAVVPAGSAKSTMLFAHIANGTPWQTGVAFLNTGATTANVEIFAMKPDGTLYGSNTFTVAAGGRRVYVLHDIVSQASGQNGGFIYVRTTNGVSLHAIELFYTQDGKVLSNVAAGSGTFSPPVPTPTPTLTSVSPTTVARGGTLTLVGTNFSTTAASNTVRFTSTTGTVDVAATTATATILTVTVPATAISGPVLVRVGGQASGTVLLSVTETSTSLVQSPVVLTAGTVASGVDIYVPTSSAPANVSTIGFINASGQVITSSASLELTRGSSLDFVAILSAGLTEATGTRLTISGSGVTLGTPAFPTLTDGTRLLRVTITAAASAAAGPRNIVVSNNNLDTTVFTGGLIIK